MSQSTHSHYQPLPLGDSSSAIPNEEKTSSSTASDSGDNDEELGFLRQTLPPKRFFTTWFMSKWYSSISLHLLLLSVNLFLFIGITTGRLAWRSVFDPQHAQSVFRGVIGYEVRHYDDRSTFRPSDGSLNLDKPGIEFNGPPRPEYEEAWANLMAHENIRVREDELGQFAGQKSLVKLSDGSGYYVMVSVFHALHCIQRLHHYIYRDHYHPNLSKEEDFQLKIHTDHCLDWLRQYVQCNADTTLIPTRWAESFAKPVIRDLGTRTCVAWKLIIDSMEDRSIDPFEFGLLVHPIFGNPYTNTAGHTTDVVILPEGHQGLFGNDKGPGQH